MSTNSTEVPSLAESSLECVERMAREHHELTQALKRLLAADAGGYGQGPTEYLDALAQARDVVARLESGT